LKRFIEAIGATPPDRSLRSAFFDKLVTIVSAGGLPHSYMAAGALATSLMFDFKCIINPHHVYIHDAQWVDGSLDAEAVKRMERSAAVMVDLMGCLAGRSYQSDWEL
jgi:hypothetical protein